MNITEEQNMNGETNRPIKYNSEAPNVVPSAKKVYSKPMLVVLGYRAATTGKDTTNVTENVTVSYSSSAPS